MAHLFHITCLAHFRKIFHEDQFLKVTESNIGSPEMFRPDPNDPAYESDMVPVWPKSTSPGYHEDRPLLVAGPLLKRMEEFQEKYPRLKKSDIDRLNVTDDNSVYVAYVTDWEPDPGAQPPLYGEHVGPDVVWLTSDPTPVQEWAYTNKVKDIRWKKDEILFVVEVPDEDVHSWKEWAFSHGISQFWYDCLNNEDDEARNWYVVEREIPKSEWVAVYMAKTGRPLWLNPEHHEGYQESWVDPDTGLISDDHAREAASLFPKPQAYFPARLRTETWT